MVISSELISTEVWQSLELDSLYPVYGEFNLDTGSADKVYHPISEVPDFIVCRTSDSTKRLEGGITLNPIKSDGPFCTIYEVVGSDSVLGILIGIDQNGFKYSYCTPDGAHMVGVNDFNGSPIVKDIYSYKTFRSYMIGSDSDEIESGSHDLMITAKTRWFRKRNNPKFLGFSKENKL